MFCSQSNTQTIYTSRTKIIRVNELVAKIIVKVLLWALCISHSVSEMLQAKLNQLMVEIISRLIHNEHSCSPVQKRSE